MLMIISLTLQEGTSGRPYKGSGFGIRTLTVLLIQPKLLVNPCMSLPSLMQCRLRPELQKHIRQDSQSRAFLVSACSFKWLLRGVNTVLSQVVQVALEPGKANDEQH